MGVNTKIFALSPARRIWLLAWIGPSLPLRLTCSLPMQKVQKVQKPSEPDASCTFCSYCRSFPSGGAPIGRAAGPHGPPGVDENFVINPMKADQTRLGRAPKCGARTRAGTPCQRLAIRGRRRCRLHGGLSPGAPRGAKNGNFRNGDWTAEAIEERKWLRSLVRSFAKTGTTE